MIRSSGGARHTRILLSGRCARKESMAANAFAHCAAGALVVAVSHVQSFGATVGATVGATGGTAVGAAVGVAVSFSRGFAGAPHGAPTKYSEVTKVATADLRIPPQDLSSTKSLLNREG